MEDPSRGSYNRFEPEHADSPDLSEPRSLPTAVYFFFFGFFFLTPPPAGPAGVGAAPGAGDCRAVSAGAWEVEGAIDACVGRLFCIFCMRDRFRASNRFRNTEECVLNLRH